MQTMQQQRGFTLIELIIVIVILGILAVTAAPRFLDLSSDATASTLQGVQGSLESASNLVRSRALINGTQTEEFDGTADVQVDVDGTGVDIDLGFPAAHSANILAVLDVSAGDFVAFGSSGTAIDSTEVRIWPAGRAGTASDGDLASGENCFVSYVWDGSNPAGNRPDISVTSTEC